MTPGSRVIPSRPLPTKRWRVSRRGEMVVGVCHLDLVLPEGSSLKAKRSVIKSLIARVRARFNCSISEVGAHDLWQRACVGICLVGSDQPFINSSLDKVIDYIERLGLLEVVGSETEFVHFNYDEG
jgi:uncharacterized protein YlxP (DUF503 family)